MAVNEIFNVPRETSKVGCWTATGRGASSVATWARRVFDLRLDYVEELIHFALSTDLVSFQDPEGMAAVEEKEQKEEK